MFFWNEKLFAHEMSRVGVFVVLEGAEPQMHETLIG
jgi:hypothetical protein